MLLAQTAARLMAEGGARDFAGAQRKAAEQLGIHHRRNMPRNDEIEEALRQYQQLFQQASQPQALLTLRQTALKAMRLLQPFTPRLVGPVLSGTADRYSPIYLHLFADTAEEVGIFLMGHHIPFEQGERLIFYSKGHEEQRPFYRFVAGEHTLELTIFPAQGLRQPPLSPVDARPQHRASYDEVLRLLEDGATP
ncbi:MAG: hypothetical protein OEZ16_00975 [Chromatiales bacterium]|nr:hypothetical protein [Chromatiales bacterium]